MHSFNIKDDKKSSTTLSALRATSPCTGEAKTNNRKPCTGEAKTNNRKQRYDVLRKYAVIVLCLLTMVLTAVGFSKWNIHLKQDLTQGGFFNYAPSFTTEGEGESAKQIPVLESYLNITAAGDNAATTIDKPQSTEDKFTVTYNKSGYKIQVTDKPDGTDSTDLFTWKNWEEKGLTFDYAYYKVTVPTQTAEQYSRSVSQATRASTTLNEFTPLGDNNVPANAGRYLCVITATTKINAETATDAAKTVAEKLNVILNPTTENKDCAAAVYFTIEPKEIAFTWSVSPDGYTYNGKEQHPTYTLSDSFFEDDDCNVQVVGGANAGDYKPVVRLTGDDSANYELVVTNDGSFTIKTRPITVRVKPATSVYGEAPVTKFKYEITGIYSPAIVDGDNAEDIFTLTSNVDKKSPVGSYGISGSTENATNKNYDVSFEDGANAYTVAARKITVNISKATSVHGETPVAKFEYEITGIYSPAIVDGDNAGDIFTLTTCFTNLPFYNTTKTYTLSNKNLVVPYKDGITGTTEDDYKNEDPGKDIVYSVLCIPQGVTLVLQKTLDITAYVGFATGPVCTTYNRGVVMNNGTIDVQSGGSITAYGYLKSTGKDTDENEGIVILRSGATIQDLFHMYDYMGGKASNALSDKNFFPVSRYTLHNVSCRTRILLGATYKAFYAINVSIVGWQCDTLDIIGNTKNALFQMTESNGYIDKWAEKAASWDAKSDNGKALYTIKGSNQIEGQRDIINISGTKVQDNIVKISVSGYSMETSKDMACPISFMNVTLSNSSALTLRSSSYKFLPGTALTIDGTSSLTTESGVKTMFLTAEQSKTIEYIPDVWKDFNPVDKKDAVLTVNGNATIHGAISGKILTDSANAVLVLDNATTQAVMITSVNKSGTLLWKASATQTSKMSATGSVMISNTQSVVRNLAPGTYRTRYISMAYAWYSESADIYYETNGGSACSPSLEKQVGTQGYTIVESDLPTTSKTHYSFGGWYLDEKFETAVKVGETTIFASCNLYARWVPITYQIVYVYDYSYCSQPDGSTIKNGNEQTYTYEKILELTDASCTKDGEKVLTFYSWFIDSNYTNRVMQIDITNFDDFETYYSNGIWYAKVYGQFLAKDVSVYKVEYVTNLKDETDQTVILPTQVVKSEETFKAYDGYITQYNTDSSKQKYFVGWYKDKNYTDSSRFNDAGEILTENLTLYGKWADKAELIIVFPQIEGAVEYRYNTNKYYYNDQTFTLPDINEYSTLYSVPSGYKFVGFKETSGCMVNVNVTKDAITGYISKFGTTVTVGADFIKGLIVTADIRKVVKVDILMRAKATYTHDYGFFLGGEKSNSEVFAISEILITANALFSYDNENWEQAYSSLQSNVTSIYMLKDTEITISIPHVTIEVGSTAISKHERGFKVKDPDEGDIYSSKSETTTLTTFTFIIQGDTSITWSKDDAFTD